MICAMARDRVIGGPDGGIPWHLPRDIAHFRAYTAHQHLLLGRRTFEEMTGWFTTQQPLVLTTRESPEPEVGRAVHTVAEAVRIARSAGAPQLVVAGGAQTYAAALPFADRLVLTLIDAGIAGAAFFPDYEAHARWHTVSDRQFAADADHPHAMRFLTLDRVRDAQPA